MSAHHDNHDSHTQEPKKVAFGTPLILGLVTLLVIVLLVSTCDRKHECCEDKAKCEKHEAKHGEEAKPSSEGHDAHTAPEAPAEHGH